MKPNHNHDPSECDALTAAVLDEFCPRFAPGRVWHVAGRSTKGSAAPDEFSQRFAIQPADHAALPDIVIEGPEQDRLFLVDTISGRGPISVERVQELQQLFAVCSMPLVLITAGPSREALREHFGAIAWGTHVWLSAEPEHLIHLGDFTPSPLRAFGCDQF